MNTNDEQKKEEVPDKVIVFQIIMDNSGNISCASHFIQDKTSCYGLLESAKDWVRELNKPRIVKPAGRIVDFMRNGKH